MAYQVRAPARRAARRAHVLSRRRARQAPGWATIPAAPDLALECRRGAEVLRTFPLKAKRAFILGRQAGLADIHVEDEGVSRQHAALLPRRDALYVVDLRSARGTYVDGKRIQPPEPHQLKEGSVITLGEAVPISYVVAGLAAAAAPPAAAAAPPKAPAAPPPQRWQPPAWAVVPDEPPALELQRGGAPLQTLDVSRKRAYVLGRNRDQADLVVPHDSVSRAHAALLHGRQGPDGAPSVHIIDLGSTKGTYVDQGAGWKRLPPNAPTMLPPGGQVRLGDCHTLLVYPHVVPPAPPPAEAEPEGPRFGSLVQSTIISSEAGADGADASAAAPAAPELPAWGGGGGDLLEEVAAGGDDEFGEERKPLSNADLRAQLMPFLSRTAADDEDEEQAEGLVKKRKKKKRRHAESDDDSDAEPAAPMVLDKAAPAGMILRKTKAKAGKKEGKKKDRSLNIKF